MSNQHMQNSQREERRPNPFNNSNEEHPGAISGEVLMLNMAILSALLPILLVASVALFFTWNSQQPTISDYVYTSAAPLFYGIVFTLGFILFAYRGYPTSTSRIPLSDNQLASLGGAGAIIVALFPTSHCNTLAGPLMNLYGNGPWAFIHLMGAATVYGSMGLFFLFYFTQSGGKPESELSERKRRRNALYRACGLTIFACMSILLAITIYKLVTQPPECQDAGGWSIVFWLEVIMQFAIATAWGVKYFAQRPLKSRNTVSNEL